MFESEEVNMKTLTIAIMLIIAGETVIADLDGTEPQRQGGVR